MRRRGHRAVAISWDCRWSFTSCLDTIWITLYWHRLLWSLGGIGKDRLTIDIVSHLLRIHNISQVFTNRLRPAGRDLIWIRSRPASFLWRGLRGSWTWLRRTCARRTEAFFEISWRLMSAQLASWEQGTTHTADLTECHTRSDVNKALKWPWLMCSTTSCKTIRITTSKTVILEVWHREE